MSNNWWMTIPRGELQGALHGPVLLDSGCLIWHGSARPTGYGLTRVRGKTVSTHRVACFLKHGAPSSDEQDACHTCDRPRCIAPSHLFWGSRSENMLDASAKRRLWQHQRPNDVMSGHQHPRAVLTDAQLREIIFTTTPAKALARKFDYDDSLICAIRNGKAWKREVARLRSLSRREDDATDRPPTAPASP